MFKLTLTVPNWANEYSKPNEIIVRAASEEEARKLAAKNITPQPKPQGGKDVEPNFWQNPSYVSCERYQGKDFSSTGEPKILSQKFTSKGVKI